MIEPFLITTGAACAGWFAAHIRIAGLKTFAAERERTIISTLELLRTTSARARSAEAVLERQREQRLIASKLGTAASQKKAAAKLAARQKNTHAAVAQIHMRPRAEVVADVAAKRAARNSGAGVDASKTG